MLSMTTKPLIIGEWVPCTRKDCWSQEALANHFEMSYVNDPNAVRFSDYIRFIVNARTMLKLSVEKHHRSLSLKFAIRVYLTSYYERVQVAKYDCTAQDLCKATSNRSSLLPSYSFWPRLRPNLVALQFLPDFSRISPHRNSPSGRPGQATHLFQEEISELLRNGLLLASGVNALTPPLLTLDRRDISQPIS